MEAASEEQSSSLSNVSDNVRSVAGLAEDLERLVAQFEVGGRDATGPDPATVDGDDSATADD